MIPGAFASGGRLGTDFGRVGVEEVGETEVLFSGMDPSKETPFFGVDVEDCETEALALESPSPATAPGPGFKTGLVLV